MTMPDAAVSIRGVKKNFGGFVAIRELSFEIRDNT